MLNSKNEPNTLEQISTLFLQDVATPNLYREIYNYDEIPKCALTTESADVPADEIWITDTTLETGSNQSTPYTA